jgi:hypothetical protein
VVNQGYVLQIVAIAGLVFGLVYGLSSRSSDPNVVIEFIELMFFEFLLWGIGVRNTNRVEDMKRLGTLPGRDQGPQGRDPRKGRPFP